MKHAAPIVESSGFIERIVPGRVTYRRVSIQYLLAHAWKIKPYQVTGPAWLGKEFYDISATLPEGADTTLIPAMLKTLLVERFLVQVHFAQVPRRAYVLVIDRGGFKMEALSGDEPEVSKSIRLSRGSLSARNATLAALADTLSSVLDRPVVDMTGIHGEFNFSLAVGPNDPVSNSAGFFLAVPDNDSTGVSIFTSLRELGLKLESRNNLPIQQLVVDQAQREPTEN